MATPAQITANRANAQLSTGPRSVEGKETSSRNSLKFGIFANSMVIPGEDASELESLSRDYHDRFQPADPVEAALVQTLVRTEWMLRRIARIEADVLRAQIDALDSPTDNPLGQAYLADAAGPRLLFSIARRQQSLQRDYFRALKELQSSHQRRAEADLAQAMFRPALQNRVRFSDSGKPQPAGLPPTPGPRSPVPGPAFDNPALRL